jgi:transposase
VLSFAKRDRAHRAAAVVGVDAGKFEHTLVVRPRGRPDSKPFAFKTTRAGFLSAATFIRAQSPGAPPGEILVAIEFAGMYGFTLAHYLHTLGFAIVSVLPAHTKRWKEVTQNQPLKTDAKDALGITDLAAQGHFVSFPFLQAEYAALRYLVSARERVARLRRATITRLKAILDVVFPEYEALFATISKKTSLALLRAYPGPDALRAAPKRQVLKLLRQVSRNHFGAEMYDRLMTAAERTLALPGAQGVLKDEIPLLIELIETYDRQLGVLEARLARAVQATPEGPHLLTIPNVAPVTAGVFLGSIGDPRAYDSSKQILKIAGLSLIERSSGLLKGQQRISKRGRPVLRRYAFILAVRNVRKGGLFRAEYEALLRRNGGKKIPALTAIGRSALKIMFSVARERRPFTLMAPGSVTPSDSRSTT